MIEASTPERRAAQAVDALRHGWPLCIEARDGSNHELLPVETAIASEATADRMLIAATECLHNVTIYVNMCALRD